MLDDSYVYLDQARFDLGFEDIRLLFSMAYLVSIALDPGTTFASRSPNSCLRNRSLADYV